ncbi:MAG: methyltransferase [Rhodovulum sulfidophilum]|uniref:Methyltransferase n=1 Tax=Rhodovulum sulfidophilum TaxID=35806 RepID=A0A2W5PT66_RHOSU|nr:MAG: methyltransferase [Rhodovulum sulfidophilum]
MGPDHGPDPQPADARARPLPLPPGAPGVTPPGTPLGARIAARIAAEGPLPLDAYMALCLGDPEHGYYTTRDPLGAAGDFTTAPEISQMFGELIGAWLAETWRARGAPARFVLAELGPGRGTLMADALRVAGRLPGFAAAAELWLVETSPALRARQAETLAARAPRFAARIDELPEAPLFLVANEFFDALPVRQFQRVDAVWRERAIGLGPDGALRFVWGPPRAEPGLAARFPLAPDGAIVEHCPAAEAIAGFVGARIAAQGGAALVIDYGAWDGTGDTLQAARAHAPTDPLAEPGEADLTAHVRFRGLAEAAAAAGAAAAPLAPQGAFLERLGITARARALARGRSEAGIAAIAAAHRRLTHPDEMGNLFRVLGLAQRDSAPLPGFDDLPAAADRP